MEWTFGDFRLTDDTTEVQLDKVCQLLSGSYWASTRPAEAVAQSLERSLNFSLFHRGRQVGFTRAITDRVTFAYLCDLIIQEDLRGQGVGQWMLVRILEHPALQVKRVGLTTRDAHRFYEKFGFKTGEAMFRENFQKEAFTDGTAI